MTSLPQKYEKNSIIKGFSLFFLEKSVIMRDLGQQNAENLAEISQKVCLALFHYFIGHH